MPLQIAPSGPRLNIKAAPLAASALLSAMSLTTQLQLLCGVSQLMVLQSSQAAVLRSVGCLCRSVQGTPTGFATFLPQSQYLHSRLQLPGRASVDSSQARVHAAPTQATNGVHLGQLERLASQCKPEMDTVSVQRGGSEAVQMSLVKTTNHQSKLYIQWVQWMKLSLKLLFWGFLVGPQVSLADEHTVPGWQLPGKPACMDCTSLLSISRQESPGAPALAC